MSSKDRVSRRAWIDGDFILMNIGMSKGTKAKWDQIVSEDELSGRDTLQWSESRQMARYPSGDLARAHLVATQLGIKEISFQAPMDGEVREGLLALDLDSEKALEAGFEVPRDIPEGREYKPHQAKVLPVLAMRGASILADQLGLGKGVEVVGGLLSRNQYLSDNGLDKDLPAVVSVPTSMKREICEEILRWDKNASVHIMNGVKPREIPPGTQYIVLNHNIMSKRLDDILDAKPKSLIIDEAHSFKNEAAKCTVAARSIAKAVKKNANKSTNPYIVMCTGTPFLNRPAELWSLLLITGMDKSLGELAMERVGVKEVRVRVGGRLRPGEKIRWRRQSLWAKRAFEMHFCGGHYDNMGGWHNHSATNVSELHSKLVTSGMIRRRKSDVISPLPPLKENVVDMQISPEDLRKYRSINDDFQSWLKAKAYERAEKEGIPMYQVLREMLVADSGDGGSLALVKMTAMRQFLASAKVDPTAKWIDDFLGDVHNPPIDENTGQPKKLIVYMHHSDARKSLINHPLLKKWRALTILSGDEQTAASIQKHKAIFQADPKRRLIICSMAAREGHTLTAASDVLIGEIPYTSSWIVQMAGRCWARYSREFEPHGATVHYGVTPQTGDAVDIKRVRIKKATLDAVIDGMGSESDIREIGEEDVHSFIQDMLKGTKGADLAR